MTAPSRSPYPKYHRPVVGSSSGLHGHSSISRAATGLLLLFALAAAASFLGCADSASAPEGAEVESVESVAPVRAATTLVERRMMPLTVELPGTVEAGQSSAVSARVMATVTAVRVQAGDGVRRGEVLVEIDAEASRGQVAQARGAVAQAQAGLALTERNYQRYQALGEQEAAAPVEVDRARMERDQALGAVEQARGALAVAESVAGDTRVVAPFAGRVRQRLVDVGDLAAPGRPLIILESTVGRRLSVAIPESVLARAGLSSGFTVGSVVAVTLDARPDLGTLSGEVVEIAAGADPMSRSFIAKIELTLPESATGNRQAAELPTGLAGRVRLVLGARAAVVIPQAALLRQGGLDLVVLADEEGKTTTRVVNLGADLDQGGSEGWREVLSGLAGGEAVLTGLAAVPPAGSPILRPDGSGLVSNEANELDPEDRR